MNIKIKKFISAVLTCALVISFIPGMTFTASAAPVVEFESFSVRLGVAGSWQDVTQWTEITAGSKYGINLAASANRFPASLSVAYDAGRAQVSVMGNELLPSMTRENPQSFQFGDLNASLVLTLTYGGSSTEYIVYVNNPDIAAGAPPSGASAAPPPSAAPDTPSASLSLVLTNNAHTISEGGHVNTYVIKSDGSLWGYGDNYYVPLGIGNRTDSVEVENPVKIMDDVISVTVQRAIKSDGSLWSWGDTNRDPNLGRVVGDGTYTTRLRPVKIMDDVAAVSGNFTHSLAVKTDGSLWAWGYNFYGQVGDGTTTLRLSPVKIMDGVAAVAAGRYHSLAIKTDGSLWAWGDNRSLQTGVGRDIRYQLSPVKIMDGVVAVAAGYHHSHAIKTDGSLWAWGDNRNGNLGVGSDIAQPLPIKVMDSVVAVAAGTYHSLAVKSDGSLWAWGFNRSGELGDGTSTDRYAPVKIMDGVVAAAAAQHSLALKTDGSLWQWGNHGTTRLSDGKEMGSLTPVKVMDGVKLPPAPPAPTNPIDSASSWAREHITTAIAAGLVPQSLQSSYTQATTRAEFAALAVAVYESVKGEITGRVTFTDTNDINVQKMAYLEVVGGVGDNRFDPSGTLTREQAAVMASRLSDAIGQPFPAQASTFADNGTASSWALEGIGRVQAAELMGGTGDNNFSPQTPYTREQSIITFLRFFERVKDEGTTTPPTNDVLFYEKNPDIPDFGRMFGFVPILSDESGYMRHYAVTSDIAAAHEKYLDLLPQVGFVFQYDFVQEGYDTKTFFKGNIELHVGYHIIDGNKIFVIFGGLMGM